MAARAPARDIEPLACRFEPVCATRDERATRASAFPLLGCPFKVDLGVWNGETSGHSDASCGFSSASPIVRKEASRLEKGHPGGERSASAAGNLGVKGSPPCCPMLPKEPAFEKPKEPAFDSAIGDRSLPGGRAIGDVTGRAASSDWKLHKPFHRDCAAGAERHGPPNRGGLLDRAGLPYRDGLSWRWQLPARCGLRWRGEDCPPPGARPRGGDTRPSGGDVMLPD